MSTGTPPVDRTQAPGPGPLRPFDFPPIRRDALSSGLPVISARTGGPPVVTVGLIVPAGAVAEAPESAGLAALTAALLESGTRERSAAEVADALESLGTSLSVVGGWEATHVELTGLRSRIDAAVDILAELVREPAFPASEVERLRAQHQAAILQRRAEPRGLANEAIAQRIYAADSPYSRPLGGTASTLAGLMRSDVEAFHAARYTPLGATAFVAGELEPEHALELVQRGFEAWIGPAPEPVVAAVRPRSDTRQVVVVDRPGAVQSEIRVGHVGVPRSTPDYFPIVVMNAILGGAFTSRLNLNLRETHGYTYGVSSAFTMRRESGAFLVSTAVQTEVTADALAEIVREVEAMRAGPVREEEVDDARNYLAGIFPLRLQTTDGVAGRLAELAMYDLPPDYFDSYRDHLVAVEVADVERVARAHLHPDAAAIVVAGDAGRIRGPLEALGLGEVEVITPAELP